MALEGFIFLALAYFTLQKLKTSMLVASSSFPEKAKRVNFVLETKQAPCNVVQQSTL